MGTAQGCLPVTEEGGIQCLLLINHLPRNLAINLILWNFSALSLYVGMGVSTEAGPQGARGLRQSISGTSNLNSSSGKAVIILLNT